MAASPEGSGPTTPTSKPLEIRTKSVEQTLVPLVTQITTLVNHQEKRIRRTEKACRAVQRVGEAVSFAVDRFVTVGQAIGDQNKEIKQEMYDACLEARTAGDSIATITNVQYIHGDEELLFNDKSQMVRAARALLSSVTKVLMVADKVMVKQLLCAKDKVLTSLVHLEGVSNFSEFVQLFSQFGTEMVELAHLSGDRQADLKDERARAKMGAARAVLERSTMMLLTSSKTCLRHPDCGPAVQNRNSVFQQMREALSAMEGVVTEGSWLQEEDRLMSPVCLHNVVKQFEDAVERTRVTLMQPTDKEKLQESLNVIIDQANDFTDSAYTSHEHREKILNLCESSRMELQGLLQVDTNNVFYHRRRLYMHPAFLPPGLWHRKDQGGKLDTTEELETAIIKTCKSMKELKKQLQNTALDQASEIFKTNEDHDILSTLKVSGTQGDAERVEEYCGKFTEHSEQLIEACRLLRHIAGNDPLYITACHAESCIRNLSPQLATATQTLVANPASKIARENLDVFCDAWESQINEMSVLVKEINDFCSGRKGEKTVYLSLPRPGKHGTTLKTIKPVKLDAEEQAKIAKLGLEMKLMTSELDAETEKWEDPDNDIVKKAQNMSSMSYSMYLFTRGEGPLKTTQDLFSQAEHFAEEGNKLFKTVRDFSADIPDGVHKAELLAHLDKIPTFCQQLNFTCKSPTVGKQATFTKVDSAIQETKNLMNTVAKVVTTCFTAATKYNLDTGSSPVNRWRSGPPPLMDIRTSQNGEEGTPQHTQETRMNSLLRSKAVQQPIQTINAFERI
ncbi:alpha-catulin-like isoform X2 [Branchiostoma floridae]|uniref:Alpha-catulin-like isoform X2 n=1 Tax=Branchiostoma floridae TaxID=7739 RepID=A0A9J7KIV2_BRAFL|nr:alpha-catulin-like isoform X2 [Branchiostoma floridae]